MSGPSHLGITLPSAGSEASPDAVRRAAALAEELGYDAVFVSEHMITGPGLDAAYGRVLEPLGTLGWVAAQTERIALGTSVLLLPLHHPISLAKQVATLQLLSGRSIHLGIGTGWYEEEFDLMNVAFRRRGRRTDEALRLMKALWAGEPFGEGDWKLDGAVFEPLPERMPEIWVGGKSDRAIRRALELGDVWHPSPSATPEQVRDGKERHPGLRVVARATPENADAFLEAGAEGVVVSVPDEAGMRELIRRYR